MVSGHQLERKCEMRKEEKKRAFENDLENVMEKKRAVRKKTRDWQNHHTLVGDPQIELRNQVRVELPNEEIHILEIKKIGSVER